jgi:hypothetical protein
MMLEPKIVHNGVEVSHVTQAATALTRSNIRVNHEILEVHNHTAFCKYSPVRRRMATSQTLIEKFLAHSCVESCTDTIY